MLRWELRTRNRAAAVATTSVRAANRRPVPHEARPSGAGRGGGGLDFPLTPEQAARDLLGRTRRTHAGTRDACTGLFLGFSLLLPRTCMPTPSMGARRLRARPARARSVKLASCVSLCSTDCTYRATYAHGMQPGGSRWNREYRIECAAVMSCPSVRPPAPSSSIWGNGQRALMLGVFNLFLRKTVRAHERPRARFCERAATTLAGEREVD